MRHARALVMTAFLAACASRPLPPAAPPRPPIVANEKDLLLFVVDRTTKRIAYIRTAYDEERDLVVIDANGKELSRRDIFGSIQPVDLRGDELHYIRCEQGWASCTLWRGPANGGTFAHVVRFDGMSTVARADNGALIVVGIRGPGIWTRVRFGRGEFRKLPVPIIRPAWFPDGRRVLAYLSDKWGLCLVDLTTDTIEEIPDTQWPFGSLGIAPDGKRVAVQRDYKERQSAELRHLGVDLTLYDLTDHTERTLARDICATSPPGWLDAHEVVFAKKTGARCDLFVVDVETGRTRQILDHL